MTDSVVEVVDTETVVVTTPAVESAVIEVDAPSVPSVLESPVGPRGPRGLRGEPGPQGETGLVIKSTQW